MASNEAEPGESFDFEEWLKQSNEITASPEEERYVRWLWNKVNHKTGEFKKQLKQHLYRKQTQTEDFNIKPNRLLKYPMIRTYSFVIDFTDIPLAWNNDKMPRHFGMSGPVLALNYSRTNRAIFKYIYKRLCSKTSSLQVANILPSTLQCTYIELPTDYAVKTNRIKERCYGVRIKDSTGKYHNYLLASFPDGACVDGHSLSPVKPQWYDSERYVAHHSIADTIPLFCGYQRPLNAFTQDDFNGPGIMKISYHRKMKERLPVDQWFHRYVYPNNRVQPFTFPKIEEILFEDKPVPAEQYYWALDSFYQQIKDQSKAYTDYIKRNLPIYYSQHPDSYWIRGGHIGNIDTYFARKGYRDKEDYFYNILKTERKELLKESLLQSSQAWGLFDTFQEKGRDETIALMMSIMGPRFRRYEDIFHRYILQGYQMLQKLKYGPSEGETYRHPKDEINYYNPGYKLKYTQIVPYYRKVDIYQPTNKPNYYAEVQRDPGRIYPFVSYCDPSFVYVFNHGWSHIFGYFTVCIESSKWDVAKYAGDTPFLLDNQYVNGVIPIQLK